jgi:hypothetical protein
MLFEEGFEVGGDGLPAVEGDCWVSLGGHFGGCLGSVEFEEFEGLIDFGIDRI